MTLLGISAALSGNKGGVFTFQDKDFVVFLIYFKATLSLGGGKQQHPLFPLVFSHSCVSHLSYILTIGKQNL